MQPADDISEGRCRRVDLTDDQAEIIFSRNICIADLSSKSLWSYTGSSMKQRLRWSEAFRHRQIVADCFNASGGSLINQYSFEKQFTSFLADVDGLRLLPGPPRSR